VIRKVRASEIGAFAFCERAWGYASRGEPSDRQSEIEAGQQFHERRLHRSTLVPLVRRVGLACLVLAVASLAVALTT
jgi:hypothetical protein